MKPLDFGTRPLSSGHDLLIFGIRPLSSGHDPVCSCKASCGHRAPARMRLHALVTPRHEAPYLRDTTAAWSSFSLGHDRGMEPLIFGTRPLHEALMKPRHQARVDKTSSPSGQDQMIQEIRNRMRSCSSLSSGHDSFMKPLPLRTNLPLRTRPLHDAPYLWDTTAAWSPSEQDLSVKPQERPHQACMIR
ncbi:hypothetical protein T484DRAFT_1906673 [Baffinella frigidus]|nr:hypothetical protein T484DRAFT_1906673 [Cryptophyta sp. CCMP2293]